MPNEVSSGGILVRRMRGRWYFAAIRPGGKPVGTWALPKGRVDRGEPPAETARREVAEETGLDGTLAGKLGDIRYVYTRAGRRIFKIVSFYLLRYRRGTINRLPDLHRHEVAEARWLPLEEAGLLLAYKGEREMAENAARVLESDLL